jgi:hypothetical protein
MLERLNNRARGAELSEMSNLLPNRFRAVISPCGLYRYRLDRPIHPFARVIAFMLHNPSTADAEQDDPTSRRGIGYARSWGAGKLVYVNPWAGRATNPDDLWKMADPVGPSNDFHIAAVAREVAASGGFFVFAWGAVSPPKRLKYAVTSRLHAVDKLVRSYGCDVKALGITKNGQPRHPLYMKADLYPQPWPH